MIFKLEIDKNAEEAIVATVKQRSTLTDQIEALVLSHSGCDRIVGYADDTMKALRFDNIECITVLGGKTFAIDRDGAHYQLKHRLYELESIVPSWFIRINKSTLANENALERFVASFSGAVDAVFRCGYRDYVSRRCFANIKRRFQEK